MERSAIVAVFVAAGDLIDPLGQDVVLRMGDVAGVASVSERPRQPLGQADLAVYPIEQEWPDIGRQRPAFEVGPH
ncbi:hypothetical protein GCM10008020_17650 [Massilia psychrophila]|nr:hypothetical protein GCM10008020_17650 [Massilia psychrophila]